MAVRDMQEAEAAIAALLPEDGTEASYADVRLALITSGNDGALRYFHTLRRTGAFDSRIENVDGALSLMLKRKEEVA